MNSKQATTDDDSKGYNDELDATDDDEGCVRDTDAEHDFAIEHMRFRKENVIEGARVRGNSFKYNRNNWTHSGSLMVVAS